MKLVNSEIYSFRFLREYVYSPGKRILHINAGGLNEVIFPWETGLVEVEMGPNKMGV